MQNEFDNPDEWEEEEPYYDWDDPDWREDWDDVDAPDFIGGAAAMSAAPREASVLKREES